MKKFWIALMSVGSFLSLHAQPVFNYEELSKAYKGNTVLVLNREQTVRIGMKNNEFDIESDHLNQMLHIDNKNVGYSEREIGYSPTFFTIKRLEASSYNPDGKGGFKKNVVKEFKDQGQLDNGSIFYDGYRVKKFAFSSLTPGTVSEMKYTYQYHDPSHLGPMYFYWGPPHLRVSHTVKVSDDVKINYRFFGDSSQVTHTVTREGKYTIHRWEAKNVPLIKSYGDAVNDRYFEPHVYIYIESYKTKEGWKPLFGDPKRLYDFSYKYLEKVNKDPIDPALKSVVDSIKSVAKDEDDVIRKCYYWVQQNLKYIAFEDGLGGQIPREANDVYHKRFGDCKDLASIITVMLKSAGIDAYLVWIGTRDLPYSFEQLPLGYASNHMIAAVKRKGKWIFIDGTSKHTPYGQPSGFTQGKEGLIAISPDSFIIEKVPELTTEDNMRIDSTYLKLEANGTLKGNNRVTFTGYQRGYLVDNIYYTGTDKLTDYLKRVVQTGNNKCEVNEVSVSNYANNDTPLVITSTYTLPDYVKAIEQDLYVNMALEKLYSSYKVDTAGGRQAAKEFNYKSHELMTYVLEIPTGYTVKSLPKNANYQSEQVSYEFTYAQVGNKIVFKQNMHLNTLEVKKEQFDEWNKVIDQLNKIYKEQVILTKTGK